MFVYALVLHKFGIQHSSNFDYWDFVEVDLNCCQSLYLESHNYNWNYSWSPLASINIHCCGYWSYDLQVWCYDKQHLM